MIEQWLEGFTASKLSKYGVISGSYFPAFGLNTDQNSVFGHFSRSILDVKTFT